MIIKYGFFSLLLLLCLSACTKIQDTGIGTELIPPIDGVITKDTNITVYVKNTSNVDTVSTAIIDDHVLGYTNDPLFGTTTAVINVQMQPTGFPFTFGTGSDFHLDSVVLSLTVRGVWGDTVQPLLIHVKELENDQDFMYDTSVIRYDNTTKFIATNELTENGVAMMIDPYKLHDSFNFRQYGDSGIGALRIRLSQDFGNRLLSSYSATNEYLSDSLFRVAFKGFQIYADSFGTSNALVRVGIANNTSGSLAPDDNTRLCIYYNYIDSTGKRDTSVRYFTPNSLSAHSNFINHNLAIAPAGSYYPSTTTGNNDNYVYLQSSPGTIATITIDSGIKQLPNWIIHRAEIIMEQAPPDDVSLFDTATAPYLFMVVKENNSIPFIADTDKFVIPGFHPTDVTSSDALFSSSVLANPADFGVSPHRKYNATGVRINYYNFNLSRYVQGILTNKNALYPLTLFTPYRQVFRSSKDIATPVTVSTPSSQPINTAGIGRVRLYGGGSDTTNTHRMKLHIVYSIPH